MSSAANNSADIVTSSYSASTQDVLITTQPTSQQRSRMSGEGSGSGSGSASRSGQGQGQGRTTVLHCPGRRGHGDTASPAECVKCGEVLADLLYHQLRVEHQTEARLQFRDVMVLSRHTKISDGSGVLRGLRSNKIPTHILSKEDVLAGPQKTANLILIVGDVLPHPDTQAKVVVVLLPTSSSSSSSTSSVSEDSLHLLTQADHVIWVTKRSEVEPYSDDDNDDVIEHVLDELGGGPYRSGNNTTTTSRGDEGCCDGDCADCEGPSCCPGGDIFCGKDGALASCRRCWSSCDGFCCCGGRGGGGGCDGGGDKDRGRDSSRGQSGGRGGGDECGDCDCDCDCDDCVVM